MIRNAQFACLVALFSVMGSQCHAQDKLVLAYRAKKGQVIRYKTDGVLSLDTGGNKVQLELKQIEKDTVVDVSASGEVTTDAVTELDEMVVNGQKAPSEEDKTVTTTVTRADGSLVSYKVSSGDKDQAKSQARIRTALTPIFSTKAVGAGDKWTIEIKSNPDLGLEDSKADYEVVGPDKVNGVDCLKVKMVDHETTAKTPISATSIVWVEKSSGDGFVSESQIENVQFGGKTGPLATGKLRESRIEGSPLGDVKAGVTAPDVKPEPRKERVIDEVVKDYEKLPGLFTLYRKKENGRETIYLELKESQLGQLVLVQATAATGNGASVSAGDPLIDTPVKFVKMPDERVFLVTPNIDFRSDDTSPIGKSIKRSFPEGYMDSYRIEAKQADRKSILINISDMFRGDLFMISQAISMGTSPGGASAPYMTDREKTYISSIKNFPDNLVIETAYHFVGGLRGGIETLADPRSMPLKVIFNVAALPTTDYKPRTADPRVGYFLTDFQTFGAEYKRDTRVHYINRWNIHKADPSAAMSAPNKKIVFWLDNATPVEYRDAVKQGILLWNKAFEKIGIKDAIVVNQMPDDADWDASDLRYNVVHWVTSPSVAYAVAHARINPLTGEVLNAGINIDGNMVRETKIERTDFLDPATAWVDPVQPLTASAAAMNRCQYGAGMVEQAWFGRMALDMLGGGLTDDKAYIQSFLREVVGHEMGHILGLRHNFIASTYHSTAELADSKLVKETGTSASLMDYNPFNLFALKKKDVEYFSSTVGPYDLWAIEYGYSEANTTSAKAEESRLRDIASRDNMPGHAFETDELADTWNPSVVRFDLAKDPLSYWAKRLDVSQYVLMHIGDRLPRNGESYHEFTRAYLEMLGIYSSSAAYASRYIGGIVVNRNHKGDAGQQPTMMPISGADQRRALQLIDNYILSADAFNIPKGYFSKLADDPFAALTIQTFLNGRSTYPVMDQLASIQKAALTRIFSTSVLSRVANNEFKAGPEVNPLTIETLFQSTRNVIWSELDTKHNIPTLHRQLQRAHLDTLIGMFLMPASTLPEDAKLMAWSDLRTIQKKIKDLKTDGLDTYSKLHLEQSSMLIARALEAKQTVTTGGAARSGSILDLLGAQPAAH